MLAFEQLERLKQEYSSGNLVFKSDNAPDLSQDSSDSDNQSYFDFLEREEVVRIVKDHKIFTDASREMNDLSGYTRFIDKEDRKVYYKQE